MSPPLDVSRLRAETPGCERVLHFNNAGAALPPSPVLEAQLQHLRLEAEIGGYEAADRAAPACERAYAAVAELLGAQPDEIAVVENATRAFDMAFYAFPFREGDRILASEVEYASNYLAFLQVARRTGARDRGRRPARTTARSRSRPCAPPSRATTGRGSWPSPTCPRTAGS